MDATTINATDAEDHVDRARAHYNDVSGREAKEAALRDLHWAEAQWRAAKLARGL